MELESLVESAAGNGASDLHLEGGMPAALRVRGTLKAAGEPIPSKTLAEMARELIGETHWPEFLERRSFDMSKTIRGVRCRINVLHTSRGVGLAIRLLSAFQATVEKLNLHPDLKKLVKNTHGLILVSGPTGSGKSSTLAALIQEINLTDTRHIVTVESPIEYVFRPRRAYIRQREVGRDTPSFEQALHDALREDPDVLMVGEMRDPETMQLAFLDLRRGVAARGFGVFTGNPGRRLLPIGRLSGSRHFPAASLPARLEHPRARMRNPDRLARGEKFHPHPRVFQNHHRHRDRRRPWHVDVPTLRQMVGWAGQFLHSGPKRRTARQRTR